MKFGNHEPTETRSRGISSTLASFSRGIATGGTQWKFQFPNGYGASVINDGYGQDQGLYEVGVLHQGRLTYKTPLTNDVLGYQTEAEVIEALDKIAALTDEQVALHQIQREKDERAARIIELEAELADLREIQNAEAAK